MASSLDPIDIEMASIGKASPPNAIDKYIAASEKAANNAASKAEDHIRGALLRSQLNASSRVDIQIPTVSVNVPPFSPNINLAASYKSDFDATWVGLETWVRGLMSDWMNTYFPTLDQALISAEDTWLLDVVKNGYSGIPVAYEQAIWDRARGRELMEANRLEAEAATQFSARGFSLPPGVLAGRMLDIQRDVANKVSTITREQAIKRIEVAVEMTKSAIAEVTRLRLGVAAALADFMRAWMALPIAAADVAKAKAEMSRVVWESSADYIRALVAVEEAKTNSAKVSVGATVDVFRINTDEFVRWSDRMTNASMTAAQSYAAQAAAARGAINTLVGSIVTEDISS